MCRSTRSTRRGPSEASRRIAKNWNFCWTELGAKYVGIVQSLIVTCRLHGIDRDRRAPLRRLLSMLQEYTRDAFLTAVALAEQYRLFDLDRLGKMVLREIAHDYCVLTLEREDDDHDHDSGP
jgi:hypothetical protein